MKLDEIIIKRLSELNDKSNQIEKSKFSIERHKITRDYVDISLFESWKISVLNILQNAFGENSIHFIQFSKYCDNSGNYYTIFLKLNGILHAAKDDYENGYLFKTKFIIGAEFLDDILTQAEELINSGYKDPACVIAGVALEKSLKDLCSKNEIAPSKLDKMNADLYKKSIYNLGMQKQITAWADRRNNAAHGNWDQYTDDDVKEMINGIKRFIAENI